MGSYPHLIRGIICALLGGIAWGFSGNCGEVLMHYHGIPAEWLTPMRMLIGCLFFLGFAAMTERKRLKAAIQDKAMFVRIALFGILGIFLMQYSYLLAIDYAGAGTALTLEQLNVIFVMIWVCLRDRRRPSLRESAGVVLAFAGVVAIATQGDITTLNMPLLGLVWGITSAFVTALYNLLPERPLEAYGTCVVNGYGMLFGCLASSLVTRPWRFDVSLSGEGWIVFAGCWPYAGESLGLFRTGGGNLHRSSMDRCAHLFMGYHRVGAHLDHGVLGHAKVIRERTCAMNPSPLTAEDCRDFVSTSLN